MDQLYMLRAFVAAAQFRSFSKAADSLNVTTGSISKAIAKLEQHIHTRVLLRTTRSVSLTEAAEPYYLSCCRLLEELDEANRRITQEHYVNGGRLRLAVHPTLVGEPLSRMVLRYRTVAPDVGFSIVVQRTTTNLYDSRFDAAILPPDLVEQSAVVRRTLLRSPRILVATRGYLKCYGTPASASMLSNHFLLLDPESTRRNANSVDLWEGGRRVMVSPMSSMEGNEVLLRATALAGAGISALPRIMVSDDIRNGDLIHILPNCTTLERSQELCLFYLHRKLLPARIRTFVDFCADFFKETPSEPVDVGAATRNADLDEKCETTL